MAALMAALEIKTDLQLRSMKTTPVTLLTILSLLASPAALAGRRRPSTGAANELFACLRDFERPGALADLWRLAATQA